MKYKLRHLNLGLTVGNIELFHDLYHPMLIGGSDGKESACNTGDLGSITGSGRSLEKGKVIHTSILAWRIPWTDEPGRLQFSPRGHKELDITEQLTLSLCVNCIMDVCLCVCPHYILHLSFFYYG